MTVAALVLAAGRSSRFGSPKALARLEGRPLLEHVLETVRAVPELHPTLVVLGDAAPAVEAAIAWQDEVRLRNPDPARGLSSSLRHGFAGLEAAVPAPDGVIVLLGDQPRTRVAVIRALLAVDRPDRPIVAPRYAGGGGPNPVLVRRPAFPLVARTAGDRGLGPLLAAHGDLVAWVDVPGTNPDVDTPEALAALETGSTGSPAASSGPPGRADRAGSVESRSVRAAASRAAAEHPSGRSS